MSEYRRYKNGLEMFLSSKKGRRLLNFAYSWGAAVVILGALFKLLHLPFGNEMLFVGMITEFLVFFISGFEQPDEQYRWEQVFPELDSRNPMDRSEMEAKRLYLMRKAAEAAEHVDSASSSSEETFCTPAATIASITAEKAHIDRLSGAIEQLSGAAQQLSRLGQLSAEMTNIWESMQQNKFDFGRSTTEYCEQMNSMSAHLSQLNQIYEAQLTSITEQVATIDQINRGLEHVKNMYHDSAIDSTNFRAQNERLVSQLAELNRIYARLLEALTVNMGAPGMVGRPYQYDPGYGRAYTDPYPNER